MNTLRNLHPERNNPSPEVMLDQEVEKIDPIIYESIDGQSNLSAALKTKGAAGPSNLDADGWRRFLVSRNYGNVGEDLRTSLANMLKIMCRQNIDPNTRDIEAFLSCRLIPLDKNPGVRPIGIGEVLRRIFGKALMQVIKGDVMKSAGSLQVCAGQRAGSEAAVHAMNKLFEEEETDAVLLVDASNAFNSLNCDVFIHNVRVLCPAMSTYLTNCYKRRSRLFVVGGMEIASDEGTTQGDPLAMPAYAVGLIPLMDMLKEHYLSSDVKNVAFADDLAGAGKIENLKAWWDEVNRIGPMIGYYPKASKSWIIVKVEHLERATEIFRDTNIQITTDGRKYLGGTIGKEEFKSTYIKSRVNEWVEQIQSLSEIAKCQPQCAYSGFIGGFVNKFTYHIRVIGNIKEYLQPVDDAIDNMLIPSLSEGHRCSALERKLLALPVKLGGLAIPVISEISETDHQNSKTVSEKLTSNIIEQRKEFDGNDTTMKYLVSKQRGQLNQQKLEEIRAGMTEDEKKANELAQANGASNWLTALPLQSENFVLSKREFYDAISIRYKWQLKHLPGNCACGKSFTIDHALSCAKGGFIYQRHNELRDTIAKMIDEVRNDVTIEPRLEPISGESLNKGAIKSEGARSDVSAMGFWTRGQKAFFDIRVFNAYAQRYSNLNLKSAFDINEKEKKRQYNERIIRVDKGSFTPLIFTTNGGMGRESQNFVTALAALFAEKRNELFGKTIKWIRTRLSFALIRSSILCIRGTKTIRRPKLILDISDTDINIIESVGYITN